MPPEERQSVSRRYIALSADRTSLGGFDNLAGAETAALAFGDGAHVVDTESRPYQPAVQEVEDGILTTVGHGSFDRRLGLDGNLIEAVKRGATPAVAAFLARGASANSADTAGGTVLIWAVARGDRDIVEMLLNAGACADTPDAKGLTPLKLATDKDLPDIAKMLEADINR